MDHPVLSGTKSAFDVWGYPYELEEILGELKDEAEGTNKEWAELLEIPASKQITLVKPSGTVSKLCNTSSGMHPRPFPFYLQRLTQDSKDPLTQLLVDEGVPYCVRGDKYIFSFPIKSPEGAVCARDMGTMAQLKLWKIYRDHWCDGNPSQTIYYTDDTFTDMQSWVWNNWDSIGGLSFFPLDGTVYDKEAQPQLEITEEEYEEYIGNFPMEIRWDRLTNYEEEDGTTGSQELACAGGSCEV